MSCFLGEGALWHDPTSSFFWIDIEERRLYASDVGTKQLLSWPLETRPGTIVPDLHGNLILGMEGYVARFDPRTGRSEKVLTMKTEPPSNRSNDGKCDPSGRLWLGTMARDGSEGQGRLYCLSPGSRIDIKIPRATIPNGIVWTGDKRKMYWTDTMDRVIREFDYEDRTGAIRFSRVAVKIPRDLGFPDGIAIDSNDMLWVAHWKGGAVCQWNPTDGMLLERIEVPAPQVTSCAFGGEDRSTLLITTAREGLTQGQLEAFPLSGSVFIARTPVQGAAIHPCRL